MAKIQISRQAAGELIGLVMEADKRNGGIDNFQYDAIEALAYGLGGMVKNDDEFDNWMKRIGMNGY